MSLQQTPFLYIDCQTTGMHPSLGEMLELSWSLSSAGDAEPVVHSRLIQVSELPWRVSEVTGIKKSDLTNAVDPVTVRDEFLKVIADGGFEAAVIHYAQFEKAFLLDFLGLKELPFKILCTHAISKRLIPNVPSRNIRALSGYFGSHFAEVKRSSEHLRATLQIWKGLAAELEKNSLSDLALIESWLQNVKPKKSAKYEYNIDKDWRLALPEKPGVYRMFAKNGEILYVGKATSLRDRVNSYFRGMRGREKRKLEMMAQAWKIEVTECGSALEAALLESDEIKKHNPPYNVALKAGNKALVYFSRDFSSKSEVIDDVHFVGPFRRLSSVDELLVICRYQRDGDARGVFYDLLSAGEISSGWEEFVRRWPALGRGLSFREQLALGFAILRRHRNEIDDDSAVLAGEDENPENDLEIDEDAELTPSEVADKFERAYMRAAHALLRARRMTRLLNCEVRWLEESDWRSISVAAGKVNTNSNLEATLDQPTELSDLPQLSPHSFFSSHAWRGLGIIDYDRMSVLDTALRKVTHKFI